MRGILGWRSSQLRAVSATLVLVGIGPHLVSTALAETWPPLKPPDPLTVSWVIKQTLTRYPEVHAGHRAYLAALERAPRHGADEGRRKIAEYDAELTRLQAIDHHLALQARVTHAFYDYALADRQVALLESYKRLLDAYVPAVQKRTQQSGRSGRDLTLDVARVHARLIQSTHDRLEARIRLNALIENRLDAPLPPPMIGEPSALPAGRDELIKKALVNSAAMRIAAVQVERTGVIMETAGVGRARPGELVGIDIVDTSAAAATHEAARAQDQRRAVGSETVRAVMTTYEAARSRRDVLKLYEDGILPRTESLVRARLASYQSGSADIYDVLDAYHEQYFIDVEALAARVDYEKSVADLTRLVGALPEYMDRTMSVNQLNVGGKDR